MHARVRHYAKHNIPWHGNKQSKVKCDNSYLAYLVPVLVERSFTQLESRATNGSLTSISNRKQLKYLKF